MPNSLNLGFSLVDYAIFGIMLVISFGIGVYHAFISSKSKEDFVMGSRNFGIIPMAIRYISNVAFFQKDSIHNRYLFVTVCAQVLIQHI